MLFNQVFIHTHTHILHTEQDAITVVFSRSVIALGSAFAPHSGPSTGAATDAFGRAMLQWRCNNGATASPSSAAAPIPGREWWVTTSILRFDPVAQWPNDVICTVIVDPRVRAYDGTPLRTTDGSGTLNISTAHLSVYAGGVTSAIASAATDGAWSPTLGEEAVPECPHDAVMSLQFNSPVDASLLSTTACLRRRQAGHACDRGAITISPSPDERDRAVDGATSVDVTFTNGALAFDTEYVKI